MGLEIDDSTKLADTTGTQEESWRRETPAEDISILTIPGGDPSYNIVVGEFEGPFDLLLHLIRKNEIDIYDIPIARLLEKYMQYLEIMRFLDLKLTSEFIEMAAMLMRIKVRMLLPSPESDEGEEDEEDPRTELVQRLVEYQKFKELAGKLRESEKLCALTRGRPPAEGNGDGYFWMDSDVSFFDLINAFWTCYSRIKDQPADLLHRVTREVCSVEEKMDMILAVVKARGEIVFNLLCNQTRNRVELIVTFLAVLELVFRGLIKARQSECFGKIMLTLPGID
jgi:segregation and condensation protein A